MVEITRRNRETLVKVSHSNEFEEEANMAIYCSLSFPVLTLISYYLCGYLKNAVYPFLSLPDLHKAINIKDIPIDSSSNEIHYKEH